jgi:hypothetical protein
MDPTSDFILKALNYGVIGFCAVCLVFVARILSIEQKRDGYPRQGIVRLALAFMVFCFALAGLNAYLQVHDEKKCEKFKADSAKQSDQLRTVGYQIEGLHDLLCSKLYFEAMPSPLGPQSHSTPALRFETETRRKSVEYMVEDMNRQIRQAAVTAGVNPDQIQACPNH